MNRSRGLSARVKLALSYAAVIVVTGALLLTVVALFLLRYVPDSVTTYPNQSDLIDAFVPRAAQAMVALIVLGLAVGWLLAGRMLAPLDRIGRAARLATQGSLSHRVSLEGRRDEFRDLADAFDSMLEKLEAQLAEEQRFAANASHELRTPLAISQTLIEVARSDPDRDIDALLARLQEVNGRAIELTEALLLLSRADRRTFAREEVDLSLLAEEAAETLLPLAEARGIRVEVTGAAASTRGSAALLQQVITNLVHNAIVHNVASGGAVHVQTGTEADAATVVVENTGAVLSPQLVATLTEPFRRGAERTRTADHAGVGLGLAIVQRITDAHDGTLELTARDGGGLCAAVRLPR